MTGRIVLLLRPNLFFLQRHLSFITNNNNNNAAAFASAALSASNPWQQSCRRVDGGASRRRHSSTLLRRRRQRQQPQERQQPLSTLVDPFHHRRRHDFSIRNAFSRLPPFPPLLPPPPLPPPPLLPPPPPLSRLFSHSSPPRLSKAAIEDDDDEDHYKILGVTSEASQKEIKAAYIEKSKLYHPDNDRQRRRNDGSGSGISSHEKFIRVARAYQTLSSRRHRREYDVELENMLRSMRNEAPLSPAEVDAKLKENNPGKYGWSSLFLPYGWSSRGGGGGRKDDRESNLKFVGKTSLYLMVGTFFVFWAMKFVEFTYEGILLKQKRAVAKRKRLMEELELERRRN